MNRELFWKRVVEKYPAWENEDHVVKLTARGLKRLMFQAMDEAIEEKRRQKREADDLAYNLFKGFGH